MHGAAFAACGLPHAYGVLELPEAGGLDDAASAAAEELRSRLRDPAFGGLSVTIPHKRHIIPFCDALTPAAAAIGAVNTVTPTRPASTASKTLGGAPSALLGDNTDWIGIVDALGGALARVPPAAAKSGNALVLGSGGTARAACYALTEGWARTAGDDGFALFVHARDAAAAAALAADFGGAAIGDLGDAPAMDALVSTVPGAAGVTVPAAVLASGTVAVLDAAYKPARTALLDQALAAGCPVAQGASMLVAQGAAQFERWNGRPAPVPAMRAAVFEGVEDLESP